MRKLFVDAWDPALLDLIERADVFQLFWSTNAAESIYVRREWEHALKERARRPDFQGRPRLRLDPAVDPRRRVRAR